MFTTLTFGIALLAAVIIPRIIGGRPVRLLAFITLGASGVYTGFLPLWSGILIALAPVIVFLMTLVYFYWLGQRALAGKMGEEQRWMAELVRDDDTEFMQAMASIDQMDVKEIAVIANNKQELKELAIERAAETNGEPVGE